MVLSTSIQISPDRESDKKFVQDEILRSLIAKGQNIKAGDAHIVMTKRSVDARHKNVKIFLKCDVYVGEEPPSPKDALPKWQHADGKKSVIIVGSGPAGLFGAFTLLEKGIKPIIVERGEDTHKRKTDIAQISRAGTVNTDSNYCFGEGGAGTFSDGKLYTRESKGSTANIVSQILATFHFFGADEVILTASHPHIGTDRLPLIINNMRAKITELGGEFLFNTRCTDLVIENNSVKGILCAGTKTGETKKITADAVLLATGHSATDIYEMIARECPAALEAKGFAVGVRVEHPRQVINSIQFRKSNSSEEKFGAAEYRITSQQDGRGVYSFCMCPGGFVVPSATAPEQIVVNGMSTAKRNSPWSNAAIVVETRSTDIPKEFIEQAEKMNCPAMAGLLWRTWLEKLTYENGDGQKAPAQRMEDFLHHRASETLPKSSYTPGLVPSRLDIWLPKQISKRLESAFYDFNKTKRGYICKDAILIASETRTSTPVRILRSKETGECTALKKLYPAGEGAGYSGGIVSSAMDGIRQCTHIADKLSDK